MSTSQQALTVKQVSDILHISTGAVIKRIERGKLTAAKDDAGAWCIPWPQDTPGQTRHDTTDNSTGQTRQPSTSDDSGATLREVEILRALVEDLRADRDQWRDQAQAALQALTNQQTLSLPAAMRELPAPGDSTSKGKSLWARLFRR